MKKIRLAILHPILSPYRIPLFENISKQPEFESKIFLDVDKVLHRPSWGINDKYLFDYEVIKAKQIWLPWKIGKKDSGYTWDNYSLLPLHLPPYLRKFAPDVIISTDLGIRTLLSIVYAKTHGKKLLVWSDDYLPGLFKYSPVRRMMRKFLIKMVDGFCSCGIENKRFFQYLGAPAEKIFNVSIAVDNEYFAKRATREAREKIRAELGLSGIVFISVGQLIARKGLDRLLRAWASLPQKMLGKTTLLIVGSGTDEGNLKMLSNNLKLSNVVFISSKSLKELPSYYAAGDIFILPTLEDAWGLVVNEAMACGKPILCSVHAGCCVELLVEGENGLSFDPLNEESTRQSIIKFCHKSSKDLEIMGKKSKEIVSGFTYDRMVTGFKQAIYFCANRP